MENQIDLYKEYGKALIQLEIWQSKVNYFKELIFEEINKENQLQTPPPVVKGAEEEK